MRIIKYNFYTLWAMKWENIGSQLHCRQGPGLEDKGLRLLMDKLWKYWGQSFVTRYCWPFLTKTVSVTFNTSYDWPKYCFFKRTDFWLIFHIKTWKLKIPLSWNEVPYFTFSVAESTQIVSSLNLITSYSFIPACLVY